MLYRFRIGDANMRSVWICSRNDAIGNGAVLLAAAETPPVLSGQLYDAARSPDKTLVVAPDNTHRDAMTSDEAITAYRRLVASLH